MEEVFLTEVDIQNVRGLQGITIQLDKEVRKHLILTGKNGSGKTSVLEALAHHLYEMASNHNYQNIKQWANNSVESLKKLNETPSSESKIFNTTNYANYSKSNLEKSKAGTNLLLNQTQEEIYLHFQKGEFILAFYKAEREMKTTVAKHIEKVELKEKYGINETPRTEFNKFLADLKVTAALAESDKDQEEAKQINLWFTKFQELLRNIMEDDSITLVFVREKFTFEIQAEGKPPFDFNTLSSGFAAVLDIVVDLILRMQQKVQRKFVFDLSGIVLIDEIETHLHLQLQRKIMQILTELFPKVQFILSTHSPFILNSLDNVVIYDLEQKIVVQEGMANLSYQGIVEGYFRANEMSHFILEKFEKYKSLVKQKSLSDEDLVEVERLESILDEIPDFLALTLATEFKRLKSEYELREDI